MVTMTWSDGDHRAVLEADLAAARATVTLTDPADPAGPGRTCSDLVTGTSALV
jgi:hypothetical protein